MILNALCDYYNEKSESSESDIAPFGWEKKGFNYVIDLDEDGNFLAFRDVRQQRIEKTTDKKGVQKEKSFLDPKQILVPKDIGRSGRTPKPNIFWDNTKYLLGIGDSEDMPCKKVFTDKIQEFYDKTQSPLLKAVLYFLNNTPPPEILAGNTEETRKIWDDLQKETRPLTFSVDGELIIRDRTIHQSYQDTPTPQTETDADSSQKIYCLITGQKDTLARLHPKIKGVRNANAAGANIVSFNQSAFDSYGKEQGANSQIGESAAFAYGTALNTLLASRDNKKYIAGTDFIFWGNKSFEQALPMIFERNIDSDIGQLRDFLNAPFAGSQPNIESKSEFHLLGLKGNNARVGIEYYQTGTLDECQETVEHYFDDLSLDVGTLKWYGGFPPLKQLLKSLVPLGKDENIPNPLMLSMVRSIFEGKDFSHQLLQMAVDRLKREAGDMYPTDEANRIAIIKGYLNRNRSKNIMSGLDKNNMEVAYNLGRLFSIYERLQKNAGHDTLSARFYSGASTKPAFIFGRLINLSKHHQDKARRNGKYDFEREVQEVYSNLKSEFLPKIFSIEQQGLFAIGYYHQKQYRDSNTKISETQTMQPQGQLL